MDTVIKDQWVKALRSGDYKQGEGYLKITNEGAESFCCLGVLCELAVEAGVVQYGDTVNVGGSSPDTVVVVQGYKGDDEQLKSTSFLPWAVMQWAGLGHSDGSFGNDDSLVQLNDGGSNFEEIADVIEKEF